MEEGFPLLIVDTDGEYWGLKERYEILHVGADDEECDLEVGPEHSEKLAELALERHVPIILDVSDYIEPETADALVEKTARQLFVREKKQQRPFLMLVEEIHEYVPESRGLSAVGKTLIRVAKRGRKRGLGLAGLSQRPANVKKDYITQCDWLVWHRLTWDNDTAVVQRVLETTTVEGCSIESLGDGEAFLWADWKSKPHLIQFQRKETYDAGATPDLGDTERPDLKSVSGDLVDDLEEITERKRKEENEIERLRSENESLKQELAEKEDELEQARDMRDIGKQLADGLSGGAGEDEAVSERIESLRSEVQDLRRENEEKEETLREARERIGELQERAAVADRLEHIKQHRDEAEEAVRRLVEAFGLEVDGGDRLRERVQSLKERNETLKQKLSQQSPREGSPLEGAEDFLETDAVQSAIEEAKEESSASYVKAVIATCLDAGGATYDEIAETMGHESTGHVHKGVNPLAARKIVQKDKENGKTIVSLNLDGLQEIKAADERRKRRKELMEDL